MNDRALPATISSSVPALVMDEQELIGVLQNSLYPGAKLESIKLVLGYCKASGLDPMQKPVHIVPISVKQGDGYAMRDVVMPGIGLYRTQASRTGEYAGVTEPEFGPTKQLKSGEFTMDYPEWCRVTVKRRMESGQIVEFTANERWMENYATQKRDSIIPNAMWKRRPFAQLAKCAEAQALRKAFPELGAAPTADEMEGKDFSADAPIDVTPQKEVGPQPYPAEQFTKNLPAWTKLIQDGTKTAEAIIKTVSSKGVLSADQKAAINGIKAPGTDKETGETPSLLDDVKRICAAALAIPDRDTAFLRLDDARILLPEMSAENKAAAIKEIDDSMAAIKGRE